MVACAGSWPRGRCSFAVSLYPGTAIPHTPKIRRSYTRKLYGNLTSGGQSPWQSPGAYVVRPRIPGEIRVTVDPRPAPRGSRRAGGAKIPNCNKHIPSRKFIILFHSEVQHAIIIFVQGPSSARVQPPEHRTVLWGWAVPFSLGATSTRSCTTCEPALLLCPPRASPSTEPRVASWRASCSSSLKACEGAVK